MISLLHVSALQQESDWSVFNAAWLLSNYYKTTVTQLIRNQATGCSACIIRHHKRSAVLHSLSQLLPTALALRCLETTKTP